MAHIGRSVKNLEAPRPLKSQSRSSMKNNFMLIEELIRLIEKVAITLQSGVNNTEYITTLAQNLRIHGPQLESVSKDTLDRAFVVFRNSSQDERLNIMTRLNLLELIELRAKGWEDNGINAYYKTKQATNTELNDGVQSADPTLSTLLSTSPTFIGAGNSNIVANAVGLANQQQLILGPGEIIRSSGKFLKPTRIPGKTYFKDEVVIRNADSGKVMGRKGRRVHMIEELSETIISFQKVNPGVKERLVQITGPSEDKINYAKHLIEDTIRRNASPVRLDLTSGNATVGGGGGSCSSLASSNSDEMGQTRACSSAVAATLSNRLSLNSGQTFTIPTAVIPNIATTNTLLHSFSTSDASLGEYKFTCNVGQHLIKITGDCCDLVRAAKLVLDDYFSSTEFLASLEIGGSFDSAPVNAMSTPTTLMMSAPQLMAMHASNAVANDGVLGSNYMSSQINNSNNNNNNNNINPDGDDDVFLDGKLISQSNGLARSRRSHFSRKDSDAEIGSHQSVVQPKNENPTLRENNNDGGHTRIVHHYEHLLFYAKSPHAWALPTEWQHICEKFPTIVRNKVNYPHITTLHKTNPNEASPISMSIANHVIIPSATTTNLFNVTNSNLMLNNEPIATSTVRATNIVTCDVITTIINVNENNNPITHNSNGDRLYNVIDQTVNHSAAHSACCLGEGKQSELHAATEQNVSSSENGTTAIDIASGMEENDFFLYSTLNPSVRSSATARNSPILSTGESTPIRKSAHSQQLLHKQIKIISDIMIESSKNNTFKNFTGTILPEDTPKDDDIIDIIGLSNNCRILD